MTTITEDYVSFEVAKLLKERGFNKKLLTYYLTDETKKESSFQIMAFTDDKIDNNHSDYCYLAPTLQMARKWLEEVYGLIISIEYQNNCSTWKWRVYINSSNEKHTDFQHYNKSEIACEVAIKYCLEHLIK